MDLNLKDKLIVVGGGAGGIGKTLYDFLREEKAKVVVADVKNGVDLGDPGKVKKFFKKLQKEYSELDGYCSLVYGGGGEKGFLETSPLDLEQEWKGTFLAAAYPIQEAVRWMKKTGGGQIVIVSSINSVLGLNEFAYDAAKGALNRIAPDTATSYGQYGIYAVTLCLGTIGGTPSWRGKEKELQKIAENVPDKKITNVNETAKVIAFLLSEHAKMFNGGTLLADRGWRLKPMFKK